MPLSLVDMQRILTTSETDGMRRLVYAVLLLHADAAGNVTGRIEEIAAVARVTPDTARRILHDLRAAGHVSIVKRGRRASLSCWHLSAIPDVTPPRAA